MIRSLECRIGEDRLVQVQVEDQPHSFVWIWASQCLLDFNAHPLSANLLS